MHFRGITGATEATACLVSCNLTQLLAHIVTIACQAMPRGGILTMLAATDHRHVVIEFMDADIARREPLLAALYLHGEASRSILGSIDSSLAASVSRCRRIVAGHSGHIDAAPSVSGGLGLVIGLPLHGMTAP